MRAGPRFPMTRGAFIEGVEGDPYYRPDDTVRAEEDIRWNAIALLLLQNQAEPDNPDDFGVTPMHRAAGGAHRLLIETLLDYNADMAVQDRNGKTPLHWAAHSGNVDVVVTLLNRGAAANVVDANGRSPLHDAVIYNRLGVATVLVANTTDINQRDDEGRTALWYARSESDELMVELLESNNGVE
jgi:ankyrin repeat protein